MFCNCYLHFPLFPCFLFWISSSDLSSCSTVSGMESIPMFLKRVSSSETASNDLFLPHALCVKYGSRIPCGVKLLVRNGYSIWLDYNKVGERLEGIRPFFQFLNICGGETLVFKHSGGFEFKVAIFNMHGCEIQYPRMPNVPLDDAESSQDSGWSFIQHLSWGRKETDSIVVPFEFFDTLGNRIPERVYLIVSSGHEVVASFSENTNHMKGLINLCNMLDVPYLNALHMLMFTFDGDSRFVITAFGNSLLQTPIAPFESEIVESSGPNRIAFQFVVKGSHLQQYEYGVDIPVEYRPLCNCWKKVDYITAYVGMRCWKLEVRHRNDRRRTTINVGWMVFRTDLQIEEGDVCVFQWKNETIRNFDVVILKGSNVADVDVGM